MPDEFPASLSFLGTGWSFPPGFAKAGDPGGETGQVLMTADEADIKASLAILFGTSVGERFLEPAYGLDMHDLLFQSLSTTLKTELEDRIRTTVLIYEPRITLLSLAVDISRQTEGTLLILMEYAVRTTNSRYNLVFPFALSDSNEIRPLAVRGS